MFFIFFSQEPFHILQNKYCHHLSSLLGYTQFELNVDCEEKVVRYAPDRLCLLVNGHIDFETCRPVFEVATYKSRFF